MTRIGGTGLRSRGHGRAVCRPLSGRGAPSVPLPPASGLPCDIPARGWGRSGGGRFPASVRRTRVCFPSLSRGNPAYTRKDTSPGPALWTVRNRATQNQVRPEAPGGVRGSRAGPESHLCALDCVQVHEIPIEMRPNY